MNTHDYQRRLAELGFYKGAIDGIWGPKSKEAARQFQAQNGLVVDGVVGRNTIAKLFAGTKAETSGIVTGLGRNIKNIFIHCSATREGQYVDREMVDRWHRARGFSGIGYHFLILLDGTIERGRPENVTPAATKPYNTGSIAICYAGGLANDGSPKDTRTPEQIASMIQLIGDLQKVYPNTRVRGHRDISPDLDGDGVIEPHEFIKACPCFDVEPWWKNNKHLYKEA